MAKKLDFKLRLIKDDGGHDQLFFTVPSSDYDLESGLVRYKGVIYDIRTGLWIIKLSMVKNGTGLWKKYGCTKIEDCKMTDLLRYVKNNLLFMAEVEKVRKSEMVQKLETMNKYGCESTLFNI